jgi:hypothetical protein
MSIMNPANKQDNGLLANAAQTRFHLGEHLFIQQGSFLPGHQVTNS